MFKKILIGLVLVVAAFCAVAAMQSEEFRVTRSATFAAPASAVFEQVNNLQKWNDWSPWAKLDPNAKYRFEGPTAGAGASIAWVGNSEVGEGKMTITESKPGELVRTNLEFVKPFAGTNTTEFTFQPSGSSTTMTWTMSGKKNFVAKCIGLVMNCEEMCGSQFEQGFANLKPIVEASPQS